MARIRTIKPETATSETLAALPRETCWTFAQLWTQCDDAGRHRADPRLVKAACYPLREDVTVPDVREDLARLREAGTICTYVGCDDKHYLHVVNWHHQKIDRPSKSRVPPCRDHEPEAECSTHGIDCKSHDSALFDEPSAEPRESASSPRDRTLDLGPRTLDRGPRTVDTATPPGDETPGQRANRLTKGYTDRVPMSRFPAVAGIVRKALTAGHTDDTIAQALGRLADEGRTLTVESLRIEIEGHPPPARPGAFRARDADYAKESPL